MVGGRGGGGGVRGVSGGREQTGGWLSVASERLLRMACISAATILPPLTLTPLPNPTLEHFAILKCTCLVVQWVQTAMQRKHRASKRCRHSLCMMRHCLEGRPSSLVTVAHVATLCVMLRDAFSAILFES